MAAQPYEIKTINGLRRSARRGIAFLTQKGNEELNGRSEFNRLSGKTAKEVRARFDHWIDGNRHDRYFHGFPNNPTYKVCFVFKWNERNLCQRLYGFIHHPYPQMNPAFQLCVLCSQATKTVWETDPAELNGALRLSVSAQVLAAINISYPDVRQKE